MFSPGHLIEACVDPSTQNIEKVKKYVEVYLKAKEDGLDPDPTFFETQEVFDNDDGSFQSLNPLHIAARLGSILLLEQLLRIEEINLDALTKGVMVSPDLEFSNDELRETPLCTAARYGHAEALRLLLIHGAKVDMPSYYPWQEGGNNYKTALIVAIQHGHFGLAAPLLVKGGPYEPSMHCRYVPVLELMRFTKELDRKKVLPVLNFMLKDLQNIKVNHVVHSKSLLEWAYSFHIDYVRILLETRRVKLPFIHKVLKIAAADKNLEAFTLLLSYLKIKDIAETSVPMYWRKTSGLNGLNAIKKAAENFIHIQKLLIEPSKAEVGQSRIDADGLFNLLISALTLWPGILLHDREAEKLMKKCIPMFFNFTECESWQRKFRALSEVSENPEVKNKINLMLGKFLCQRKGELTFEELDFGVHLLFEIPPPLKDEKHSKDKECREAAIYYKSLGMSLLSMMKEKQLKVITVEELDVVATIGNEEGNNDLIGTSGFSERDLHEKYQAHVDEEVERIWGGEDLVVIEQENDPSLEKEKPDIGRIERSRTESSSSADLRKAASKFSEEEEPELPNPPRSRSFVESISSSRSASTSTVKIDKPRSQSFLSSSFSSSFLNFGRGSTSHNGNSNRSKEKEKEKDKQTVPDKIVKMRSLPRGPGGKE